MIPTIGRRLAELSRYGVVALAMNSTFQDIAEPFWLAELGAREFVPGVQIQAHAEQVENDLGNRAVCFVSGDRVFVTAPQEFIPELRAAFSSVQSPIENFISTMRPKGRVVGDGPAYVGYTDSIGDPAIAVYPVSREDERVQRLAVDYPNDWSVFGLTEHSAGPFAVIGDGQILGLSQYNIWGGSNCPYRCHDDYEGERPRSWRECS